MFGGMLAANSGGFIGVAHLRVVIAVIGARRFLEGAREGRRIRACGRCCCSPAACTRSPSCPICKMVGRPAWWVILLYIPIVNFVVLAILSIDLAKSFGKSTGYGIGLWLLSFIFYPMLGFGDAAYEGPSVARVVNQQGRVGVDAVLACRGEFGPGTHRIGARGRQRRGHRRARGVRARPADAHQRAGADRHPGGVRVVGHQHGDAAGRGGPRRPLALRLGLQRVLPRQPDRHRGRPAPPPTACVRPIPFAVGLLLFCGRPRGRRPGARRCGARDGPGPAGPRGRVDVGDLLRVHRPGVPARAAARRCSPSSPAPGSSRRSPGPALAGVVGSAFGWRWVFLGLLPLCAVIGLVALAGVAAIDAPEDADVEGVEPRQRAARRRRRRGWCWPGSGRARRSSAVGAGRASALALGLPALRRLLPPGTLVARRGMPATVLCRGLLTFAFFAGDAYVPYALITVRGLSSRRGRHRPHRGHRHLDAWRRGLQAR